VELQQDERQILDTSSPRAVHAGKQHAAMLRIGAIALGVTAKTLRSAGNWNNKEKSQRHQTSWRTG